MQFSRRELIRNGALGSLLAALPAGIRLSFAATTASTSNVVIFLFKRGGMDGLNLVAPSDDANLIQARPAGLRLLSTGTGAALPLANGLGQNDWRLHPSAPELKALYDAGHLAFIPASGNPAASRSHFQMQSLVEHGIADPLLLSKANGWIGQYATDTGIAAATSANTLSVVAANATLPPSMGGDAEAVSLPNSKQFTLGSADRTKFLNAAYASAPGLVGSAGRTAIGAVTYFQKLDSSFVPPKAGTYATDSFSQGLAVIAELIKLNVGLQMAEVEYSNWDTHVNQQPRFAQAVTVLSKGIGAFYNDIAAYANKVTLVAMSEFGRRVQSNADLGTDHGHGNVMTVLGGNVRGGRLYGNWLGLSPAVLNDGDVPVTTDFRSVLSEVLTATRGVPPVTVFPGFTAPAPLGLFN
jgi:uncharacterized protein (DUF1501 family)